MSAKASTSVMAFTVRVEEGRTTVGRGSKAHGRSSSPQKSPEPSLHELKKPVLPPLVVQESRRPLTMKSISFTRSPSRTTQAPGVKREGNEGAACDASIFPYLFFLFSILLAA
ncbi:hypothetical protein VIGAN_08268500 [Vigna angularis var. angularis]|uniref:Uncharacterized protein n=1 Tax=Vigna angularis var. angularis TaxID=157739 RepID=A0A0S3SSN9_PHAAN|nr:hypothetical protein VIGAN_08268500 [Vigna angularis var. angularis]